MSTAFDPTRIQRPDPRLLHYYVYCALLTGPFFPITLLPLWLRYVTLRYKFDDDGVSMSYGVFFRREVNLTYRRIQDIHVTCNLLQRWMGLATISLQTASGSAQAELTVEGILEVEELRDFLYARMRGAREERLPERLAEGLPRDNVASPAGMAPPGSGGVLSAEVVPEQTLQTLIEIRDALAVLVARQGAKP